MPSSSKRRSVTPAIVRSAPASFQLAHHSTAARSPPASGCAEAAFDVVFDGEVLLQVAAHTGGAELPAPGARALDTGRPRRTGRRSPRCPSPATCDSTPLPNDGPPRRCPWVRQYVPEPRSARSTHSARRSHVLGLLGGSRQLNAENAAGIEQPPFIRCRTEPRNRTTHHVSHEPAPNGTVVAAWCCL